MKRKRLKQIHQNDRTRLTAISFFLTFLFSLLIFQFYKLQIVEGDKWEKEASSQHKKIITEYFMRGTFYSNCEHSWQKPLPLVLEVPKFHLFIDPEAIPIKYKKEIVEKFMQLMPAYKQNKAQVLKSFYLKKRSRKIAEWLDVEIKTKIEKWWLSYARGAKIPRNALFFVCDYKRSYPYGPLLGQVLHTVQDVKDGKTFQAIPTGGLELYFNKYLQGKLGKRMILRSPRHPLDTGVIIEKPQNGADIYLTINHYLQAIAEEELSKGVKKVNGKGGWAVMIDPYNGEILALAQTPAFDLSNYKYYFNDSNLAEHTRIHAAIDSFEPGSIFKPIVVALFLKANEELIKQEKKPLFFPEEKVDVRQGNFPGRKKPITDVTAHKYLNMYMGIQKSSNIYMCKMMQRLINTMKEEWLQKNLIEVFSLGKKTNIEIPAETSGMVPSIGKIHPNGKLEWSLSTPYSIAIGHNLLVTSLQIAKAYCILVNGGYDIQPTLIKKIVRKIDGEKKVLKDNQGNQVKKQLLSNEISKEMIKAMKYTTKIGGTAYRADVRGYTEGGKTGTSEKIVDGGYSNKLYISSFVGFVPANHPRFVLMITVDEPEKKYDPQMGKCHMGGACAAPIFKQISERSLQYLGITPDDPHSFADKDPRYNVGLADWQPEVKNLREQYQKWNQK